MNARQKAARDIDEYIAGFPSDVQKVLQRIRKTIRKAAPEAEEIISYQMPAFRQSGNLVYFAAWKEHIGFYPGSTRMAEFEKELSAYEGGKGTIQFPLDEAMPLDLIGRIVKFRVRQNLERAASRVSSRTSGGRKGRR